MFCPIEMFDFHSSQTGVTSRLYTMYPEMKRLSKYFYSCSCSSVKQALLGSGTVRAKMYLSGCFFDWHPPTSSWHYLWESFSFCRLSLGWFNHINLNSFYSIFYRTQVYLGSDLWVRVSVTYYTFVQYKLYKLYKL